MRVPDRRGGRYLPNIVRRLVQALPILVVVPCSSVISPISSSARWLKYGYLITRENSTSMAEKKQNKRRWIVGAAVLVILLILGLAGSCIVSERTALGWKDDDYLSREWVGEIASIEIDSFAGDSVVVNIDFGVRTKPIRLAHTKIMQCGLNALAANAAVVLERISTLLPAGTAVRVVRFGPRVGNLDSTEGYIYTSEAAVAEPPATISPTTSAVTPSTSTGTPAPTSTEPEHSIAPEPDSINEVLLEEGYLALTDPDVDLSAAAEISIEEQIVDSDLSRNGETALFNRLVDANRRGWDTFAGLQAGCRADDQVRLDDKARRDEETRLTIEREQDRLNEIRAQRELLDAFRAGPEGILDTEDDDRRLARFDADGNVYVPDFSSSDGGSGGSSSSSGGGFCRHSRWC